VICVCFFLCDQQWLLLVSDGVTHTLSNAEIAQQLRRHLGSESRTDPAYAVGSLLDDAVDAGSDDNLTAVLVQIKGFFSFFIFFFFFF